MTTEAQRRAIKRYDHENTVGIFIKLNRRTDEDIIRALEETKNKQGLIKEALRNHIRRDKNENY